MMNMQHPVRIKKHITYLDLVGLVDGHSIVGFQHKTKTCPGLEKIRLLPFKKRKENLSATGDGKGVSHLFLAGLPMF